MHDVFLCHSEKDLDVTIDLARQLEEAGYTTWYYKRDSLPGGSYLIQVGRAVLASRCIVLIASRHSLESGQVTAEIVRAYEAQIPFIPLLLGITHRDVQTRQEIWHQALITWTSLPIERGRIGDVLPQIVRGLENLDIRPVGGRGEPGVPGAAGLSGAGQEQASTKTPSVASPMAVRRRLGPVVPGLIAAIAVVVVLILWLGPGARTQPDKVLPVAAQPAEERQEPSGGAYPADEQKRPAPEPPKVAPQPEGIPAVAQDAPAVVADLAILVADSSRVAETTLVTLLSSMGKRVARRPDSGPATLDRERRALDGDDAAGQEVARLYGAAACLIGRARVADVASGYGFHAARAEFSVRLIDAGSGNVIGRWSASKKVTLPDRDQARRSAVEGAAEDAAIQMVGEPRLMKKN